MPESVLGLLSGAMMGILASALASAAVTFLGKWLYSRRWKLTLKIGHVKVEIDLSDPDRIPATLDAYGESPRVFLAYSHKDSEFVDRLAKDLRNRGIRVWLDSNELKPGDSIQRRLDEGLSTSGYMLAVLSKASLASQWATREMEMAMHRELKGKWPRVIPVVIDDVSPPKFLANKIFVDLGRNYEEGLDKVIQVITSTGPDQAVSSFG